MTASGVQWSYPYEPTDKQLLMHRCQSDEILFGGAGGGGKTDGILARAVTVCMAVPNVKVLLLRKTFGELDQEIVPRLRQRIPDWVAHYSSQGRVFTFRHNGAILRLGFLQRDDDMYKYIGAEYQLIIWDELTMNNRRPYVFLRSRLRAAGQVAADMRRLNLKPQVISTTNPGGRGHGWVKKMFVDPAAPYTQFTGEDGKTRTYIPAKATDNEHLDLTAYMKELDSMDETMARAIRDGDWDVLEGVRFSGFRRAIHVVRPQDFPIPIVGVPRAMGVDYGLQDPFAALWGAKLYDGLVVVYRELSRTELTAAQQAQLIIDSEAEGERTPERPIPVALDPATWSRSSEGVHKPLDPTLPPVGSIAWYYRQKLGPSLVKARNDRIAGWALVDEHLRVRADGLPRLLIYDTCTELIRTLPELQRDNVNPEDADTHGDDHVPDALRYLLMQLVGGGHPRVTEPGGGPQQGLAAETAALAKVGF